MMKKTFFLLIIICFLFAGCGKEEEPETVTLNIVSNTWYAEGVGDSNTQILTVKTKDEVTLNGFFEPLVFTVVKADKKEVLIETKFPLSEKRDDLDSTETSFTIKKEQPIVLYTLTTDVGTSYSIKIME